MSNSMPIFFNKANLPIVKGRVINADPSQLDTLTIKYIIQLPYSQKQVEKKCKVEASGNFQLEFDYPSLTNGLH